MSRAFLDVETTMRAQLVGTITTTTQELSALVHVRTYERNKFYLGKDAVQL
jgi:hypothetical protein